LLRRVTNGDDSRRSALLDILEEHPKVIIFYNFTYELNILRECLNGLSYDIGEWNGEVHSDVPTGNRWAYLVQYTAGCEGWNCITTDTMIFYSQSYSYRMTEQAMGRIDRVNTPYKDLNYYFLKSTAPIDIAIARALSNKKNFNERSFKGR
jgi:superfamily II DNA or RNA helicase